MTKIVKLRRGTTAQLSTYAGPVGELVVDTDLNQLVLQYGADGGYVIPRAGSAASFTTLSATGTVTFTGAVQLNNGTISTNQTTISLVNTTATTVNFAGAATTGNFGYTGTAASTTNLSTGATATATTKTLNLGTGGATGSTSNINIGSSNGGTTTINSPALTVNGTGIVNIGSGQIYKDAAGNVGINSTSPATVFYVKQKNGTQGLTIESSVNDERLVAFYNTANAEHVISATFNTTGAFRPLSFFTSDTRRLTIDIAGNVGIGTSTPGSSTKLNVSGRALFTGGLADPNDSTASGVAINYNGTTGFVGAIQTGVAVRPMHVYGSTLTFGSSPTSESARFTSGGYFKASNAGTYQDPAGSYHESRSNANQIVHLFAATNTGSNVTDVYSILPSGAAGYHFIGELTGTGVVYRVLANGNVQNTNNSYGSISDRKVKFDIVDAPSYLERFMRVKFRKFKLIGTDYDQFGVVAQELQEVFPGLVDSTPDTVEVKKTRTVEVPAVLDEEGNEVTPATTTEETYTEREPNGEVTLSVKYSVLAQMQGKVIQELNAKLDAALARIEALEAK